VRQSFHVRWNRGRTTRFKSLCQKEKREGAKGGRVFREIGKEEGRPGTARGVKRVLKRVYIKGKKKKI